MILDPTTYFTRLYTLNLLVNSYYTISIPPSPSVILVLCHLISSSYYSYSTSYTTPSLFPSPPPSSKFLYPSSQLICNWVIVYCLPPTSQPHPPDIFLSLWTTFSHIWMGRSSRALCRFSTSPRRRHRTLLPVPMSCQVWCVWPQSAGPGERGRKSDGALTEADSTMSRLMTQITRQMGENKESWKLYGWGEVILEAACWPTLIKVMNESIIRIYMYMHMHTLVCMWANKYFQIITIISHNHEVRIFC